MPKPSLDPVQKKKNHCRIIEYLYSWDVSAGAFRGEISQCLQPTFKWLSDKNVNKYMCLSMYIYIPREREREQAKMVKSSQKLSLRKRYYTFNFFVDLKKNFNQRLWEENPLTLKDEVQSP